MEELMAVLVTTAVEVDVFHTVKKSLWLAGETLSLASEEVTSRSSVLGLRAGSGMSPTLISRRRSRRSLRGMQRSGTVAAAQWARELVIGYMDIHARQSTIRYL